MPVSRLMSFGKVGLIPGTALDSLRGPILTDESSLQTGFRNETYEAATRQGAPRVCEKSGTFEQVSSV